MLIFRLGSIGDTVVALPCFHAIARAYPAHRRVLLTNSLISIRASSAESVLDGTGLVDEVIYYPTGKLTLTNLRRLRDDLRRIRASCLIYLAERPTVTPVLRDVAFFKMAGITRIVGAPWTAGLRECRVEPETSQLEHEAGRLARVLGRFIPVDLSPPAWDMRLSDEERAKAAVLMRDAAGAGPVLAIAPGARLAAKDWGIRQWSRLISSVTAEHPYGALVLVGAADERALCTELAYLWKGPVINLCGALTPRETAAALGRCQLMVCHDSGPMHLAAAEGVPCLALFGNYNRPRRWYPFGQNHRVIHEPRGMGAIGVERVAAEIRSFFAEDREDRYGTGR